MNFGERAAARRKSKELKSELKELRGALVGAGGEKNQVAGSLRELQEALELAEALRIDYEEAREHLFCAREQIRTLLDFMGESPADEVQKSLSVLVTDLELVYHDCSIREDDLDFRSTIRSLKQMVGAYQASATGMQGIMLRSELENIKAVLDDASGWKAPDFFALAYYFLHEDRGSIKEMENAQRNQYVLDYVNGQFRNDFMAQCERAGMEPRVSTLMQNYVYGRQA